MWECEATDALNYWDRWAFLPLLQGCDCSIIKPCNNKFNESPMIQCHVFSVLNWYYLSVFVQISQFCEAFEYVIADITDFISFQGSETQEEFKMKRLTMKWFSCWGQWWVLDSQNRESARQCGKWCRGHQCVRQQIIRQTPGYQTEGMRLSVRWAGILATITITITITAISFSHHNDNQLDKSTAIIQCSQVGERRESQFMNRHQVGSLYFPEQVIVYGD